MSTHTQTDTQRQTDGRRDATSQTELQPGQDIVDYVKSYARQKPEVAALWCLGIGFILGWKLKPW